MHILCCSSSKDTFPSNVTDLQMPHDPVIWYDSCQQNTDYTVKLNTMIKIIITMYKEETSPIPMDSEITDQRRPHTQKLSRMSFYYRSYSETNLQIFSGLPFASKQTQNTVTIMRRKINTVIF